MINAVDCFKKYGVPDLKAKFMTLWDVPADLEIGFIPKRIYCNKDLIDPLCAAFCELVKTGLVSELKTWDGCFNIRVIRGYEKKYVQLLKAGKKEEAMRLMSIHSWALAVDMNAFENQLNTPGKLSKEFTKCFTDNGFDWGGKFKRPDPMHFQLAKI